MRMYRSLLAQGSTEKHGTLQLHHSPEAPALSGFMCGNSPHPGCLTLDDSVRLHSCEKGTYCSVVNNAPVVWIQPIVAHLPDGRDMVELGIGGGADDLEREAELDLFSPMEISAFLEL
jgi:DNA cross-link repair 1C protein